MLFEINGNRCICYWSTYEWCTFRFLFWIIPRAYIAQANFENLLAKEKSPNVLFPKCFQQSQWYLCVMNSSRSTTYWTTLSDSGQLRGHGVIICSWNCRRSIWCHRKCCEVVWLVGDDETEIFLPRLRLFDRSDDVTRVFYFISFHNPMANPRAAMGPFCLDRTVA